MLSWDKLSHLSREELTQLQNAKLRNFISRHLYPFSPYYRRLFDEHKIKPRYIKSIEDLRIIPFTRKDDFVSTEESPQKFRDFILQPDERLIKKYWGKSKLLKLAFIKAIKGKEGLKKTLEKEYRPIFLTATTGTTNQPISFLYSAYDIENLYISGYRLLEVFGTKEDVRAVNLFPYAPHLAFWQTVFAGLAHNEFVLSTGGGKTISTQASIDLILKVKPNLIIGVPGYLYHLTRTAKDMAADFSFIRKIVLGASAVPLGFKEKLAGLLRGMGAGELSIIGTYGFTEAKCAWGECPTAIDASSGYHTYPDKEIFEVIDPHTGEVKGEGEDGELVYTSIDARGSVVVRYRTGDLVKGGITYAQCPYCKCTVPRISSQIYRAHNIKSLQLSKVKGTLVNLNTFTQLLEAERAIEEWQIEIRKKDNDPFEVDELVIYLSIASGIEPEGLKEKLKYKIQSATEVTPNEIIILTHKEMLEKVEMEVSHKVKRIVDKRPTN
ncbi:MAG: AMP-binding protein [Candidatus Omnitrophota bacterium]|nr:AMP-binding protein [Candidatus Omnitrophota bacterium]